MSGHSHWATIKHKKSAVDAKRGKLWSKLSKAIIVAAKHGGGDADMNIRLRAAIDAAKAVSLPKENITRAIKRGTGEAEGMAFEEITYEGYGAGGVAMICELLTDNRNRTAPEIRKIFEICGGKLGAVGSVAWMFDKKGLFMVSTDKIDEDKLMELALEAGADDVKQDGDKFAITCEISAYRAVSEALTKAGIQPEVQEITLIPKNTVDVDDPDTARRILKLMEKLDDHDDVQNVVSNFNIPDEIMAQVAEE
jgi:YebC/PmpR family DNA-binding regulatory protein